MRLMFALCLVALTVAGAAKADAPCAAAFDDLRTRAEQDYVGFALGIAPHARRLADYRTVAEQARRDAAAATSADCTFVLRRFVAHFDDPHVFVLEDPKLTTAEADALRARSERLPLEQGDAGNVDTVEGVWAAPEYDVRVRRLGQGGSYAAVVTRSRAAAWAVGDVAARFEMRRGQMMATLFRAADRAPLRYPAALQRDGQLLHMPPITWGRRAPRGGTWRLPFDPERPRAPSAAPVGAGVFALAIPSFSPEHQQALAGLLAAHDAAIQRADLLIVDLRGNEGGSSHVGFTLEPYYFATPLRAATGPRPYPIALSSPRLLRYFDRIRSSMPAGPERAIYDDFMRRAQAAPGRVLPVFPAPEVAAQAMARRAPVKVHAGPRRVAIIVDRHAVSAAEAFLIEAKRSPRVRVFGENTGGSIDYQNVAMFAFGSGALQHILGLPTLASSDELPERGFNRAGVPVDARLPEGQDWIGVVMRHRW